MVVARIMELANMQNDEILKENMSRYVNIPE
jgi:hypothetical protein